MERILFVFYFLADKLKKTPTLLKESQGHNTEDLFVQLALKSSSSVLFQLITLAEPSTLQTQICIYRMFCVKYRPDMDPVTVTHIIIIIIIFCPREL